MPPGANNICWTPVSLGKKGKKHEIRTNSKIKLINLLTRLKRIEKKNEVEVINSSNKSILEIYMPLVYRSEKKRVLLLSSRTL